MWIPWAKNIQVDALAIQVDALAALASSSDPGLKRVIPVEFIEHLSIGPPIIANLIHLPEDDVNEVDIQPEENLEQSEYGCDKTWLETIWAYIADGTLPVEKWAAQKIKTQATQYVLVDGKIYKWRFVEPLMTCIERDKAQKVIEQVHYGSCGNHYGGRLLAIKIKYHGYYWPTMIRDCKKLARKCEKC